MKNVIISTIKIDNLTFGEAISSIQELIKNKIPSYVVTPNIDHIMITLRDKEFKKIYESASLSLADGMPILWAAKFLKTPLKEKISGSDLFVKLCKIAAEKEYRLFFLGGKPGSASKAAELLGGRYPKIQIVGIYSPQFGFEQNEAENKKIVKMIKDSKPDILFVALGAPKQEKWIYKYKDEYNAPLSIGIGAAFEFFAGVVKRAPKWMQNAGLEWFWRLMMEPKRLWKRYLVDDMKFFWLIFKQKLRQIQKHPHKD